jgi:AbrB family looped-hinge helix DNA binding protein
MPETTTVTQKGQVTIPVKVRRQLGLKPRDRVIIEADGDSATIRKATSRITAAFGSIKSEGPPKDWRTLREEFEQGVADEVMSETAD